MSIDNGPKVDRAPRSTTSRPCDGGRGVRAIKAAGGRVLAEAPETAVIFGMPDQRLTIRHDSGTSARPYVDGALMAIRKVSMLTGVQRGLDAVLDLE